MAETDNQSTDNLKVRIFDDRKRDVGISISRCFPFQSTWVYMGDLSHCREQNGGVESLVETNADRLVIFMMNFSEEVGVRS